MSELIVQKFGGTSVADPQKILAAARKAIRAHQRGARVVMVVSAMGKNTDMLVDLASQVNEKPPAREMDMLLSTGEQVSVALMAMAIDSLGHKAVSLTGAQIGIRTDSTHTKARIRSISTERMRRLLDEGNIVIAAGFQGIDEDFNITTLGRGGSDTTAVALAAVLGADACEIYTDVDGVYTTDPRLLPEARRVERISYDEMLELASLGAGVMHNRSIEFAKKYGVTIHVRNSMADTPGTLIVAQPESRGQAVCGAALTRNEARVTLRGVRDEPGVSCTLFSSIAARNITVDMIVQDVGESGRADISFTVPEAELADTLQAVEAIAEELGAQAVEHDRNVAKVSVVGLGMAQQTGVATRMFRRIADAGVNIQMITTSEIKISVLVDREFAQRALREVHQAFELEKEVTVDAFEASPQIGADAADVVERLQGAGMEDLMIDEVRLDETQARVTINQIPDTPGIAAQVFEMVAEAGIFVDMIVQSHAAHADAASLSFTIPRDSLQHGLQVAKSIATTLNCGKVDSCPEVAKLSVSGVGMRSHTGVAIGMFRALTEANINIALVNTSEVRVNVVVDGKSGQAAKLALEKAFGK
ncbi:MAG: aspartate kinase [Planctomycetales bacterium]|nr:aspartate kinase [Planctomycetales bacterium]